MVTLSTGILTKDTVLELLKQMSNSNSSPREQFQENVKNLESTLSRAEADCKNDAALAERIRAARESVEKLRENLSSDR